MKKTLSLILFAVAVLAGCQKNLIDQQDQVNGDGPTSFIAYIDDDCKTSIDGVNVHWTTGDEVKVNGKIYVVTADAQDPKIATLALKTGQSAPTGTSFRACFPSSAYNSTAGKYSFPNTQSYNNNQVVNPMYAVTDSKDGCFHFKNVGGLLAIDLTGTGTVSSIAVSADEAMAGTLSNVAISDQGALNYTVTGTYKSVTLTCNPAVQLNASTPTRFYVAVAEGDYNNLNILVNTSAGNQRFKAEKKASVKKNNIYHMAFDVKPTLPEEFAASIDVVKNEAASFTKSKLHIKVTPNNKDVYYMLDVLPATRMLYISGPEVLPAYDMSLYSFTTFQQYKVAGLLYKGDQAEISLEDLQQVGTLEPEQQYIVFAYVIDEELNTSNAVYTVLNTKESVIQSNYSDYIGKWVAGTDLIEVSQKEEGVSYNVTGFTGMVGTEYPYVIESLEAKYRNGYFVISEQATDATLTIDPYGPGKMYLSGLFVYNQALNVCYPGNCRTPNRLMTGEVKDDEMIIYPGKWTALMEAGPKDFNLTYRGYVWMSDDGQASGRLASEFIESSWKKYVDNIPESLLGQWTCSSAEEYISKEEFSWTWTISKQGAGIIIDNFDPYLAKYVHNYGGTALPSVNALYDGDDKSGVITVPDQLLTPLNDGYYYLEIYGYSDSDYSIKFNVDFEKGTITLPETDFFEVDGSEPVDCFLGPIEFTKGSVANAAKSGVASNGKSKGRSFIPRKYQKSLSTLPKIVSTSQNKLVTK